MSARSWIEMPVSDGTIPSEHVRPMHVIQGSALLVYRGEKVYAALDEPGVVDRIAQLPDVRRLTPDEAVSLEATLPGGGMLPSHRHTARPGHAVLAERSGRVGLGDVIGWLTRTLRIQECGPCSQRKKRLNRITIWRQRKG
jgi:hypothetical protein